MLILPGSFEWNKFFDSHQIFPIDWREAANKLAGDYAFIQRPGSFFLECVGQDEAREYVFGGEYDERLGEIGDEY